MAKDEPTNGELAIMIANLHETTCRIENTGKDTNVKATYTNGRVTKLEEVVANLTKLIERHDKDLYGEDGVIRSMDKARGSWKTLNFIWSFVVILISTIFTLYIKDLKRNILDSVNTSTDQTVQKAVSILEEKFNLNENKNQNSK